MGHQAYPHKILTGRRERFHTLRQKDGISGFPKRTESEYDAYGVGHASTSISAALGMALARDRAKGDYKVAAIIGDGSLSGGPAMEGLNVAGHHQETDFLVIVNDNEMSISPSVGAIYKHLSNVIVDERYNRFRSDVQNYVKGLPRFGWKLFSLARRVEEAAKALLTPGILFEDLGFRYVGPVDGHDLEQLVKQLTNARELKGPTVLHVLTKKGKGYTPAEKQATTYHGLGPFDIETGKPKKQSGPPAYTKIFSDAMLELAAEDEKIVALTAAMPEGTGLDGFRSRFPDRFYDVGIAEASAVIIAAGMAVDGLRPVAAIYSTFLQRAYDIIAHDVALQKIPITFALDRGGVVGDDGPTHHGTFDFSYLRHLPDIIVSAPMDENEMRDLLYSSIYYDAGPWSLRYPRGSGEGIELRDGFQKIEPGTGVLMREGGDILLLGIGREVYRCMEAAEELAKEGIEAAVINARFVKPLDEELILEWAKITGKVLTVEDHQIQGGFGSAVLELFNERGLLDEVNLVLHGYPDEFVPQATPAQIYEAYGLDGVGIAKKARTMLGVRGR